MEKNLTEKISQDRFEFIQENEKLFDKAPQTKPVGYYKDALRRFKRNKASVVGACIILFLVLFAVFGPLFSPNGLEYNCAEFKFMPPSFSKIKTFSLAKPSYEAYLAVGVGAEHYDIVGKTETEVEAEGGFSSIEQSFSNPYRAVIRLNEIREAKNAMDAKRYEFRLDRYKAVGFIYKELRPAAYAKMKEWEAQTGNQLIFPMAYNDNKYSATNANIWYKVDSSGNAVNENGRPRQDHEEYVPNYVTDDDGVIMDYVEEQGGYRKVRVLAENWYLYTYGRTPSFIFGTNSTGQDIFVRLAHGIRTSMMLAIFVTVICFIIGSTLGATQGYYGGWFDLIVERIKDVLVGLPFGIVLILIRFYWIIPGIISPFTALLIAYIALGWIGDAGAMRSQFYRFKHQEYVLAARTLGAKDRRIMFRHILPNAWGTIITGLSLAIPSIILSETTLSYLGIVNLDGPTMASLGAMLSDGTTGDNLQNFPHIVLFPAIIISLLMICFNLFGNGLRDAFNPQLRGVED